MTGSGLNTKKIKQYVLTTNWTTGLSNANKAQKSSCQLAVQIWVSKSQLMGQQKL